MTRTGDSPVIPPPKLSNVDKIVKQVFDRNMPYVPTGHAKKRLANREVTLQEVKRVLISGKRRSDRDEFKTHDDDGNLINRWSYAFVGRTRDGRKLRVCVSFQVHPPKAMLIVTVCNEEPQ